MSKGLNTFLIITSIILCFIGLVIYGGSFILSKYLTGYLNKNILSDENIKIKNLLIIPFPPSCSIKNFETEKENMILKADKVFITTTYGNLYSMIKKNTLASIGTQVNNLSITIAGQNVNMNIKKATIKYKGTFTLDWLIKFDFLNFIKNKQNVYFEFQDINMANIDKLFEDSYIEQKYVNEYIEIIKLFTTFDIIKINVEYDNLKPAINIKNFEINSKNLKSDGKCKFLFTRNANSIYDIDDIEGNMKLTFVSDKIINIPLLEYGKNIGCKNFNIDIISSEKNKTDKSINKAMISFTFDDFYYEFDKNDKNEYIGIFFFDKLKPLGKIKLDNFIFNYILGKEEDSVLFSWKSREYFDLDLKIFYRYQDKIVETQYMKVTNFNNKYIPYKKYFIDTLKNDYGVELSENEDINIKIEEITYNNYKITKNNN